MLNLEAVAGLVSLPLRVTNIGSPSSHGGLASCLVALGSNVGRREQLLRDALSLIGALPGASLVAVSGHCRTAAVGGPSGQGEFLNAAAVVATQLAPEALLQELLDIETRLGRQRGEVWSARTIDLDLLLVDDLVLDTPTLILPHPRMSYRPFVLSPAVEVAGSWPHPVLGATLDHLWRQLSRGNDCLVIYGGSADDRQWHAAQLLAHFDELRAIEADATNYEPSPSLWLAAGKGPPPAPRSPKLAIFLQAGSERPYPGRPTLTLPASGREEVLYESLAAVEGIWIDLGRNAPQE